MLIPSLPLLSLKARALLVVLFVIILNSCFPNQVEGAVACSFDGNECNIACTTNIKNGVCKSCTGNCKGTDIYMVRTAIVVLPVLRLIQLNHV
jgi:hypothetical protein